MSQYHKIYNTFERDPETHKLVAGQWKLPEFEYLQNTAWVGTEKVDGTNIRLIVGEAGAVEIRGKTDNAQIPVPLLAALTELVTDSRRDFGNFEPGTILYGEGYGPKIQKVGSLYSDTPKFVLFDVRVGPWWLQREDLEDIARAFYLDLVPILAVGTLNELVEYVRAKPLSTWGDFVAEGLIAKPLLELRNRAGNRIITKIKVRDYD